MGQLVLLVYCLLTRKHRSIYGFLFTEIKSKLEQYDIEIGVESFRCDFEDAAVKGFFDVFPDVGIECCFFHFPQAHWRKICELEYLRGIAYNINY